jgi:hypothetical protein
MIDQREHEKLCDAISQIEEMTRSLFPCAAISYSKQSDPDHPGIEFVEFTASCADTWTSVKPTVLAWYKEVARIAPGSPNYFRLGLSPQ